MRMFFFTRMRCYSNSDCSGFDEIHGLLDYIMQKMKVPSINETRLQYKGLCKGGNGETPLGLRLKAVLDGNKGYDL